MNRITHPFTNRDEWLAARRRNINSTEIAALFGVSPYMTALELALVKAGKIAEPDVQSARTDWGQRLQAAIAEGVERDYACAVEGFTDYLEIEGLRVASSFDYRAFWRGADSPFPNTGPGILEIKNLDPFMFAKDWHVVEGQLEAAPHIELQLQHQLLVSGLKWGAIAVLVGGNSLKVLIREVDDVVGALILERVAKFWTDLDAGRYPAADMPADAEVLARLYNFGEPGTFLDGTRDAELAQWCATYTEATKQAKIAEEAADVARAEILQRITSHEKAVTAGYKISTWMVAPKHVEYDADGYRSMRITPIKQKEQQ